jgi:hypothetical protein
MRRTPLATLLLSASLLSAQKSKHTPPQTETAYNTSLSATNVTSLPVTRVSLYKNGVGFFEHTGHITGNAAVTIDFTSGQLNDVLQSLTAIDLNGGRISGAGYNSTTPLEQQLKNLPLPLGETPTSLDFYNAIRGSRVEVTGNGPSITGRLLSIEERTVPTRANDENQPTKMFLTVVSELGETRTVELTGATSVHLLDTALHTDVTRYLQLLDANRSQGLRHLTLQDNGTGTRELRLSYISEVPVWKSTYRILFTDSPANPGAPFTAQPHRDMSGNEQTATLQGWSVVDNTTGADWINVQLSLIAGAPQSFIQPLSQPIYSRRPEVPIAQEAQLTPQTFDSSIEADKIAVGPPPPSPMMAKGQSAAGGVFGGMGLGTAASVMVRARPAGPAPTVAYEEAATTSITPTASAASFDDFFAYNLTEPVTIRKNESALVPILQTKITADRVTLVTYNGSFLSQPLRALWVTNTSNLTLDRGSFSIVENGNFGGEGLLDPIHPNEKRLLSYAADQAVHVTTESNKTTQRTGSISAAKGVLKVHHDEIHEITYVIHNAATEPRTVVLEEPVVNGFVLDSEKNLNDDPKPTETTPTVYRFRVTVAPGATERLHSGATRKGSTTYALANTNDNQLTYILHESNDNPTLTSALQPILDARRKVADAQTAVDQTSKRLTDLRADEDRQRANITALANADKGSRDRFVHDLNTTEDNITAAQKELTTRTLALDAAKADLATHIEAFQIDTH